VQIERRAVPAVDPARHGGVEVGHGRDSNRRVPDARDSSEIG
jgi:hypothetical protein